MDAVAKKLGYLKGLMEGMDFSENPAQGKLMGAMCDLMSELSDHVGALEEFVDDLNDYVESIDDDLSELEGGEGGDFRHLEDEDEFDDEYMDGAEGVQDRLHLLGGGADAKEAEQEAFVGVLCPLCTRLFFVSADDGEDAVYTCPHCGKRGKPAPLTPENAPIARPEKD